MSGTSGTREVHVVVTCTNRKSRSALPDLHVGSLPAGPPERRAADWIERITRSTDVAVPVRDLYAGEHWQVVRDLDNRAHNVSALVRIWVCSAGYGLVALDASLRAYRATFAFGQPDSVATNNAARRSWWPAVAAWPGPTPGHPRTFRALARQNPEASLVVAASPAYLSACTEDLAMAATELAAQEQLAIISIGHHRTGPLDAHIVPADARLQPLLGGTRQALNVRLLTHLLTHHEQTFTTNALAATTAALLAAAPPLVRYGRTPSTDEDVATFIRVRLRVEPSLSRSRLLREYRDSGRACEQSRFAGIYDHVQEDLRALDNS